MVRDRDAAGRARNARPRDGLGRPLPRGGAGVPTMPEHLALDDRQTLGLAQRLLDADRPFHAHEVLESRWKAVDRNRELWQGLAQLAVGMTHAARGNDEGARRLIARGRDRLREAEPGPVDIPAIIAWADAWLAGQRHPLRITG